MAISYKRLWKLLIDKDLKKKDLIKKAGISNYTLNKLNKGETVTSETLANKIRSINHPFISNLIASREIVVIDFLNQVCIFNYFGKSHFFQNTSSAFKTGMWQGTD